MPVSEEKNKKIQNEHRSPERKTGQAFRFFYGCIVRTFASICEKRQTDATKEPNRVIKKEGKIPDPTETDTNDGISRVV